MTRSCPPRLFSCGIGCHTCTTPTAPGEHPRAGRWRHITEKVGGDQPLYVPDRQNGLSIIRCVSADVLNRSSVPIFNNVGQGWIFLVVRWAAVADGVGGNPVLFFGTGLGATRLSITAFPANSTNTLTIGGRRLDTDGFLAVSTSTTRASVSDRFIIQALHVNWAAAQVNHWTNGTPDLTAGAFHTAGNTSPTDSSIIGAFGLASLPKPDGTEIGEFLVFENDLPVSRQTVEGYLAWKWGLQTSPPANHPFRNRPPLIGD
jgi:hypothetical protein